jgi:O-antigen ligase
MFQADSTNSDTESGAAAASAESRKYLFFRSLDLTMKHPIFGAGQGVFSIAEAEDAEAAGMSGNWHASHNTYTQYSAETGIPSLILFLIGFVGAYRGLTPLRNNGDIRIVSAALMTQMSIVIIAISMMFLSVGAGGLPYVVIGMSGTLQLVAAAAARSEVR